MLAIHQWRGRFMNSEIHGWFGTGLLGRYAQPAFVLEIAGITDHVL
jgi:hypothetical protein